MEHLSNIRYMHALTISAVLISMGHEKKNHSKKKKHTLFQCMNNSNLPSRFPLKGTPAQEILFISYNSPTIQS